MTKDKPFWVRVKVEAGPTSLIDMSKVLALSYDPTQRITTFVMEGDRVVQVFGDCTQTITRFLSQQVGAEVCDC